MTSQAQAIANLSKTDFQGAVQKAVSDGLSKSTGFGTREYTFQDGSTLGFRGGKVEFPLPERNVFRDSCGDIEVR